MNIQIRRAVTVLILVAAIATVTRVFYPFNSDGETGSTGKIAAGALAPDFDATTLTGEKVSLKDYQGKRVLLNFWASWCKLCMREMPLLNKIHISSKTLKSKHCLSMLENLKGRYRII
ncbi:redoxin domain-containing protein [Paenibacillus sp. FSL H3-0321]|uniref:redoxin domain-containing protein n=1 Tax=unclassified Paenibacillus TaxID=185978 RepID=UPI004046A26E